MGFWIVIFLAVFVGGGIAVGFAMTQQNKKDDI